MFRFTTSILLFAALLVSGSYHVAADEQSSEVAKESANKTPNSASTEPIVTSAVGLAKRVEQFVLPGGKLKVKAISDRHEPFVLRIIASYSHGSDTRYDFEFYGLEPGDYNLVQYLEREAGTVTADANTAGSNEATLDLPPLMVRVLATLPAGQITPAPIANTKLPWLGGYRWLWIGGGVVWLLGLYALLFVGRKKKETQVAIAAPKISLADQLRPLVQAARDGKLGGEQRAALERTLIAFWCKRLQLGSLAPGQVIAKLREHSEAGPLVRSLEDWLHRPDPPDSVNIDALLSPYANVTDVDLDIDSSPDLKRSLEQGASVV